MADVLYVGLQEDDKILRFGIDAGSGKLVPGGEPPAAGAPSVFALSPDRRVLYVGYRGTPAIESCRIDPASGALTSMGRVATEHALLDDNGDRLGIGAEFFQGLRATKGTSNNAPLDGPRAHQWHLVRTAAEQAIPPAIRAKRDELELAIDALRRRKATMPEESYYSQLEDLMLQLARLYQGAETTAPTTLPAAN